MKIIKLTAEKYCRSCCTTKPLEDFYPDAAKKLGVHTYCKPCAIAKAKVTYKRRKSQPKTRPESKACGTCQEVLAAAEFWAAASARDGLMPECKGCRRERYRRYRYGFPPGEYDRLLEAQAGACACCGTSETVLVVDHRHADDLVRGLLCSQCNTAIGLMAEDPDRLIAAAAYLMSFEKVATG